MVITEKKKVNGEEGSISDSSSWLEGKDRTNL